MKYLKTNDTIWEVISENDLVYKVRAKNNPDHIYSKSKKQLYFYKVADNIFDLIQRVVLKKTNYKIMTKKTFNKIGITVENATVYGAIWTPTGLKYVAKLNKGVWELL